MPMPPDLRGARPKCSRVQVHVGDDVVSRRPQQDLLQERVGDDVLDHDVAAALIFIMATVQQFGLELTLCSS